MTYNLTYRRILSKIGYYNYQNGLIFHHINQSGDWEGHQQQCRSFILKAVGQYNPEKITVLGSGWLLDLPLAELTERVKKICLIDIIHPPDVIRQVHEYRNVELVEQDITGGLIELVWEKFSGVPLVRKRWTPASITIPEYKLSEPGLVVSLNILTQLESLLADYIKKRTWIDKNELLAFRRNIQKQHLSFLMKHKSIIVTDFEEIITSRSGVITIKPTLFTDLPAGDLKEEWTWNFDRRGGDMYNSNSQFKIVALTDLHDKN